jgi:hypothetical protein
MGRISWLVFEGRMKVFISCIGLMANFPPFKYPAAGFFIEEMALF